MHQFSLIPDIDFRITDFTCGIDARAVEVD